MTIVNQLPQRITASPLGRAVLILAVAAPMVPSAEAADGPNTKTRGPEITVSQNVQVSRDRKDFPHMEVIVAADPRDPDRLVAGAMISYSPGSLLQSVAYISDDGGRTWRLALERRVKTDENSRWTQLIMAEDPSVAFGPEGSVIFTSLAKRGLFRSVDGGKSWQGPTGVDRSSYYLDREYIMIDCSNSRYRGRLYWHSLGSVGDRWGVALVASDDCGKTFRAPQFFLPHSPFNACHVSNSVITRDGTVIFLYGVIRGELYNLAIRGCELKIARSCDRGASFDEQKPRVARWNWGGRSGFALGVAGLGIDPGSEAFGDRLYAVWANRTIRGSQILLARSADKGATWTEPITVSGAAGGDDNRAPFKFIPAIAVNRDGVVAVTWYEALDVPEGSTWQQGRGWNLRFSASLDGGHHWLPTVALNSAPSLFEKSRESVKERNGRNWPGDTAGLAATVDGVFHPLWIDNRDGIRQVWTARITVR